MGRKIKDYIYSQELKNQASFYENADNFEKTILVTGNGNSLNVIACLKEMENGGGSAAALKEAAKYGVTNEIQAIIDSYTSGQPSPVILTFNGDSNVSPIEGEVVDEGLTFCNPFIGENGQPNAIYSDNTCGIDGVDNLPVFNKDIS